ncbi:MAG: anthranilate synthase component I family protein, partial [Cyanobacteria bacterium P01_F01_bin.42]
TTQTLRSGQIETYTGNPFEILAQCLDDYKPATLPELPTGIGGLFGFWGYELINWIEPRVPTHAPTDSDLPDGIWMQADNLLIFDQVKRKIFAIAYADLRSSDPAEAYQTAVKKVNHLVERLRSPSNPPTLDFRPRSSAERDGLKYRSNTSQEQFCTNVLKAKDYIKAGDIFQVVISQKLSTEFHGDPFHLYRSLRQVNPSPYMAYFNFNGWQIIGSSPEVMVKAEKSHVPGEMTASVRPIAGTRPRGHSPVQDLEFEQDLLSDPKERAEHVMLVDLGRNDLGRVCDVGTVAVEDGQLMVIERYSHVMHIVSSVIGQLSAAKTAWDLLKACFPAGTVSGAPKIRAMEIIHELEGCRRGPYSGVYGYYDFEGQLNTAITIRSMIVRPGDDDSHIISVQAGAGIVADSIPQNEYQETLNKAKGLLEAIQILKPPTA